MDTSEYKYQYIFPDTNTNLTDDQFDILMNHVGYIYYLLLTGKTEYAIDDGVIGSKYGAFTWKDAFDVLYDTEEDTLYLCSDDYYVWMDELIDDIGVDWSIVEVIAPNIEKIQ